MVCGAQTRIKAFSISKKILGITVDMIFLILKVSTNNFMWGKHFHDQEFYMRGGEKAKLSSSTVMGGIEKVELCPSRR